MCICVFTGEFSCRLCPQHTVSVHHIWARDPPEGPGQVSGGFPAALQCQRGPEPHPGASFAQDHDALQGSRPTQRPAQDRWHRLFCLLVCTGMCLCAYVTSRDQERMEWGLMSLRFCLLHTNWWGILNRCFVLIHKSSDNCLLCFLIEAISSRSWSASEY